MRERVARRKGVAVRPLQVDAAQIELWYEAVEPLLLVLLGCRVTGPALLSPPALRRANRAAQALQSGIAQHILVCGGKAWSGVREADAMAAYLLASGVAESALSRELWSRSTRQNAKFAGHLLLPRGISRIGVVTCDWHMPRALACFRRAGFQPEPIAARSPQIPNYELIWRAGRERVAFAIDEFVMRAFSRS